MALKKSELYSSLWQSCDELRGGMDASQYKDYVLSLLFIKYISDKYAGQPYAPIKIPKGATFSDMIALKGKSDIGDQINKKIIAPLASANQALNQSDFPDFNDPVKLGDGKEKVERLTNLIAIFESKALDFSKNRADGDDILGDAYEYLMRHFATESGKSKGQFYTPAEQPHGVLFRGNVEANIRRNLIRKEYIKGIIGLPANLFYGTGIPACIVVTDKEHAHTRKGIFMLDASAGYMKDGPKNRLRERDIHKIVDVFNKQLDVPKFSRMVPYDEIEKNDFNLNLPRYIDSQQVEDLQDIEGHLRGGIPQADVDALSSYWDICPNLQRSLFKKNRKGYLDLKVDKAEIKTAIYQHPEFATFISGMNEHFATWRKKAAKKLKDLAVGCHPKEVIALLAEGLLHHYLDKPLIDPYAIYQHLMDFWAASMQDDCYLIADDGWKAEPTRVIEKDKKGKEKDKGWACDLVPKPLIVARYFPTDQAAIDALVAELETVTSKLAEIEEEHGGEEGLLSELEKVNKANVTERLKEIKGDKEAKEEAAVLNDWLKLNTLESELKKKIKDADAALDAKAYGHYSKLSEADVKSLVVDHKWLASLDVAIHGEMDRISQQLTNRVKELAERYERPLPQLSDRVSELEAKVNGHLERMGFAWK